MSSCGQVVTPSSSIAREPRIVPQREGRMEHRFLEPLDER
jgi:hypothetical protein